MCLRRLIIAECCRFELGTDRNRLLGSDVRNGKMWAERRYGTVLSIKIYVNLGVTKSGRHFPRRISFDLNQGYEYSTRNIRPGTFREVHNSSRHRTTAQTRGRCVQDNRGNFGCPTWPSGRSMSARRQKKIREILISGF
jgi:hypothetical protein